MDSKELKEIMEAYSEVYAPQEVDEATAMAKRGYDETKLRKRAGGGEAADRASALENRPTYGDSKKAAQRSRYARAQRGDFRNTASSNPGLHVGQHKSNDPKVKAKQAARGAQRGALTPNERKQLNMGDETFDIFDTILEFLYVEGYAETFEDAEWMMANIIDEEAIDIILGEAITSEKGKAKAAAMIAARSTPSGRAKSGQGANVAAIKHISRANVDNLGGTPPNPKIAKNPVKSRSYGGTGNKAARRAAEINKEEFEFWVDSLVEEGYDLSGYTWDEMYEFYLDEAITSEKGKAKAAEMIAKRTTPSGRAKSGQGASVAQIKHISRANVDNLGGTPPNPKIAKNPVKSRSYGGTGNKAARRAAEINKEEFEAWLDEAMSSYERNRKRAAARAEARNAARDAGKTGVVPGVGYVSPRREKISLRDKFGTEAGIRMAKAKPPSGDEKH